MPIRGKNIEEVDQSDLQVLIDNSVWEDKYIEYKEALPHKNDEKAKTEFLADLTSFANTAGGDLIFGIECEDDHGPDSGKPKRLSGIAGVSVDEAKNRLLNMMQDGINPRLLSPLIQAIDLS